MKEPKKKDTYEGLHNSTQLFSGIGLMEALGGDIVLRGRGGERDHLIPLDKAVEKYSVTYDSMMQYARYGVRGWDTLKDIVDDLKVRIIEAHDQRKKLNRPITQDVVDFVLKNR